MGRVLLAIAIAIVGPLAFGAQGGPRLLAAAVIGGDYDYGRFMPDIRKDPRRVLTSNDYILWPREGRLGAVTPHGVMAFEPNAVPIPRQGWDVIGVAGGRPFAALRTDLRSTLSKSYSSKIALAWIDPATGEETAFYRPQRRGVNWLLAVAAEGGFIYLLYATHDRNDHYLALVQVDHAGREIRSGRLPVSGVWLDRAALRVTPAGIEVAFVTGRTTLNLARLDKALVAVSREARDIGPVSGTDLHAIYFQPGQAWPGVLMRRAEDALVVTSEGGPAGDGPHETTLPGLYGSTQSLVDANGDLYVITGHQTDDAPGPAVMYRVRGGKAERLAIPHAACEGATLGPVRSYKLAPSPAGPALVAIAYLDSYEPRRACINAWALTPSS